MTLREIMAVQPCLCHKIAIWEHVVPGDKCVPCRARKVLNAITTCLNAGCAHSVFDHSKNTDAACTVCDTCTGYA